MGKQGEEIWTDKYGRIKVQFHWDREGQRDENSSCWVRVAQGWAGKRWGSLYTPRIGQEVVVSFLEGDPDQPLVTGSVYNADTMPPCTLPEHATRSTIKSHSSKGGGGYNELRFDDKKGAEQVFLHAQKNLDQRVLKDSL
nr:type VI secretion system tip protein TssI/VgrG [Streptomyces sp. DSM 41633]